jgi:hypothetical protein
MWESILYERKDSLWTANNVGEQICNLLQVLSNRLLTLLWGPSIYLEFEHWNLKEGFKIFMLTLKLSLKKFLLVPWFDPLFVAWFFSFYLFKKKSKSQFGDENFKLGMN